MMYKTPGAILLAALAAAFGTSGRAQPSMATLVAAETTSEMLAVQIRLQGFTCDKPHGEGRQTLAAGPWRLGPQMRQRDVPDQACSRYGGEGRAAAVSHRRSGQLHRKRTVER